jgi:hypothetical protein
MAGKWNKGHIGRFWSKEDYKNFEYVRQPLMDSEIKEWESKGYDYVKSFSGCMYDSRNPMPDWVNRFDKIFDLNNMTYNFYKMSQLEIMPDHVDHFQTYMRLFNVEYNSVRRILVMLDDWKPGHYLEVDGVGFTNWVAGDYFIWDSDVRHAAANIGTEDRYTLQITGTVIQSEEVYKNVHWYNMPDMESRKDSLYSPEMSYMKQRMNKSNPYFIYMYNQHVKGLEKITHTPDAVDKLNQDGVDIYLFEPLCSYLEGALQFYPPYGTKHTLLFYSEFHYDKVKNPENLRSDELDSIVDYIDRNKLTNVTVHTCDYNSDKFYPYYKDKMNIVTDDLFLAHFDTNEFDSLGPEEDTSNFSRKFICMNWRYAPHRQLIASYLANYNDVYMTWYYRSDMGNVSIEPWYSIHNWLQKNPDVFNKMITGFRDLNNRSPYCLDLDIKEATAITHNYLKNMFPTGVIFDYKKQKYGDNKDRVKTYYNDVFCDVVTESRFAQPTSNYSEKVYRPMFYLKPFIMVGPPHTLQYMKEQGFETFSEFWDESYDTMEDHESRLFAIFKLLDEINNKSIAELREMYAKMKPILEHNRNVLLEKCPLRS